MNELVLTAIEEPGSVGDSGETGVTYDAPELDQDQSLILVRRARVYVNSDRKPTSRSRSFPSLAKWDVHIEHIHQGWLKGGFRV